MVLTASNTKLSDIVFSHREPSPIRPAIDDILYALGDPQIVVTASLLLDLIELAMMARAIPCEPK